MGIRTRRAHKHSKTHIVGFGIAGFFGFIALLAIALVVSLGDLVDEWLEDLPDYTSADAYLVSEPTRVYDADGNEIASYYLQNRISVDLDEISDYVLTGTVDTEDKRFYSHNGIDPQSILRAVVGLIFDDDDAGGGSTITQQLVRNTVLSDEQFEYSIRRKVREAYIAIQMEKMYTKDEILNMYLNTIYYGNGAYGIEAAAITYFNKSADELTLAEAATLVGLPNAPGYYDPFTNPDACIERRNLVLERMLEAGDITEEEYEAACAEDLVLDPGEFTTSEGTYPYFTDYVQTILLQDFSSDTLLQGGLKVYTTIDPYYQEAAEEAVAEIIEAGNNDELGGALVTIDNDTGYILAMVGGQNYGYDADAGESSVNLATSGRQAGSSFKTFTLIAAMLEGMSPTVMIDCSSPMQVTSSWTVQNFDDTDYGVRTLASATAVSSNTAFAQVVVEIGVDKLIEVAHLMGIDSELDSYYSLTLGSSEVTVLEMCEAYSTLASGGIHRNAVAIVRIEDRNGDVIYEHTDDAEQVIDSAIAVDAIEVLEGVISTSATAGYVARYFTADQPVAGKTGTSDNSDNLWFCGFTPQLTTVVWVGCRDSTNEVIYDGEVGTTSTTSQPIWTNYMNTVLEGVEREEWPESDHEATYADNDTWSFVGTSSSVNEDSDSDDDDDTTEEPTTETTQIVTETEEEEVEVEEEVYIEEEVEVEEEVIVETTDTTESTESTDSTTDDTVADDSSSSDESTEDTTESATTDDTASAASFSPPGWSLVQAA